MIVPLLHDAQQKRQSNPIPKVHLNSKDVILLVIFRFVLTHCPLIQQMNQKTLSTFPGQGKLSLLSDSSWLFQDGLIYLAHLTHKNLPDFSEFKPVQNFHVQALYSGFSFSSLRTTLQMVLNLKTDNTE